MSYPLTNCFICGQGCKDWGGGNQNACLICAIKLHQAMHPGSKSPRDQSDPKVGDVFPNHSTWDEPIRQVREQARQILGIPLEKLGGKKVYTDLCPCGIHYSQCDYHK